MIYIVMGVSGCGKSTIGALLAKKLALPFYDADDFHPKTNIKKMAQGKPLNDDDRKPWLTLLADNIIDWQAKGGAVLACSALKQNYRDILSSTTENSVKFVYLKGDKTILTARLTSRDNHFMPANLLTSQLATLEPPKDAITVLLEKTVEEIISDILKVIK